MSLTALSSSSASRSALSEKESVFGQEPQRLLQGERPNYEISRPLGVISGFTNYNPTEMKSMSVWKATLAQVFQRHGFAPMEPRPVEYAYNLEKVGGIGKQIYGVSRLDGGLTLMGLPFDRTVPMAIMVAQHHHEMAFPYGRYDIGWSWRGEHASKGRFRAFIQADVDIIDQKLTVRSDAQCIVATVAGLLELGVPKCQVLLNHIDVAHFFLQNAGVQIENYKAALRVIDKLKPNNEADVIVELCEHVPEINPVDAKKLLDNMNYRGPLSSFKFPDEPNKAAVNGLAHLREIERIATLMGIPEGQFCFAPNLARGLDYYTGVVFETYIPGKERYGSIASGGRYDNLIGDLKPGLTYAGVGGSIGVTRLFDILCEEKLVDLSQQTTAQVFVGYRTEECFDTAVQVASSLRKKGLNVELHNSNQKVKGQLNLVDKKGIPFAAFVMNPDEIIIKEMRIKKDSEGRTPQETFSKIEEASEFIFGKVATLHRAAPADEIASINEAVLSVEI